MIGRAHEPKWKRIGRQLLRAVGRLLPLRVQMALARGRPKLAWIIQPGRTVAFKRYLGNLCIEAHTDSTIERQMLTGEYEPHLQRVIQQFVPPNAVCLDIGANVGPMTLAMAKRMNPGGRVHAFEPAPMLMRRLQRNVALNPQLAPRVQTHSVGLGLEEGSLYWLQSSAGHGNGRLLARRAPGSIRVPVTTLDAFAQSHHVSAIDFIKIDVERMELDVILGGAATLHAFQPVIVLETLPCHGIEDLEQRTRTLLATLRELGYELHAVHRRHVAPLPDNVLPSTHEILALPPGRNRMP